MDGCKLEDLNEDPNPAPKDVFWYKHLVAPWFLIARVETKMSGKVDEENLVCTIIRDH